MIQVNNLPIAVSAIVSMDTQQHYQQLSRPAHDLLGSHLLHLEPVPESTLSGLHILPPKVGFNAACVCTSKFLRFSPVHLLVSIVQTLLWPSCPCFAIQTPLPC